MLTFSITVSRGYNQRVNYVVRQKPFNDDEEHFIVQRESERYVIKSNRPFFRRRRIMKRRPDFTLISEHVYNQTLIQDIYNALWEYIKIKEAARAI